MDNSKNSSIIPPIDSPPPVASIQGQSAIDIIRSAGARSPVGASAAANKDELIAIASVDTAVSHETDNQSNISSAVGETDDDFFNGEESGVESDDGKDFFMDEDDGGGFDDDDMVDDEDSDFGHDDDDDMDEDMVHADVGFNPIRLDMEKEGYQSKLYDYSSCTVCDITKTQEADSRHIADLCCVPVSFAYTLLREYRWNKEKLLERFMEDSEGVMKKCGLPAEGSSVAVLSESGDVLRTAPDGFMCPICCTEKEENPELKVVSLTCGHEFCSNCFSYYVTQKIRDEGECRRLECPSSDCHLVIVQELVQKLVDPPVLDLYQRSLMRAFVDDAEYLKWCPAANCDQIVKCDIRLSQLDSIVPSVRCTRNHNFCFGCGLEHHDPCICRFAKSWLQKCADDSETSNWIAANTKECPKCHYTIEKNGGCNHMSCKNCKYEFCWVCMGPWSEHGNGYYNCNRFNEQSSVGARESQAKSRAALERYLHYFNRYNNHEQSAKLASKFFERSEKKMEELQLHSELSWIEVQFIKRALEVVNECRTTLKWTYAFAYYLKANNMSELFEDNQRDLEVAVESLNEIIEGKLPTPEDPKQEEKLSQLKQACLDKTEYCSRRRRIVLEDTLKGLQEERWSYREQV